ncbi:hypothetical protein ACIG0C_30125 [Kitasatospora aureofaciens]|nr:hypothetical protein [Kitasatospora aureofaciens]ARF83375.1 hypothetical protein B6264_30195 [Kitasatospora aureofaciens]OEV39137.1 hypothetical protein HS99_0017925 [Kitasatospora aureofaciens]
MQAETGTQQERVMGRAFTVRLDPYGRPTAGTVRLSCSAAACADQRFPSTAEGRRAAVEHVKLHVARVRTGGGPRGNAYCACLAGGCAWHVADPDASAGRHGGARPTAVAGAVRCGGPVVLAVYADRAGRLWRLAETCARCAAATPGCRVLAHAVPTACTAPAAADQAGGKPTAQEERANSTAGLSVAAAFSDHTLSPTTGSPSPTAAPAVPGARTAAPAKAPQSPKRWGKIAQRVVPSNLQPDSLRAELVELGDAFRDHQKRPEPDHALLAELQERKARAFDLWADVTGDANLRLEAQRARQAAQTERETHRNRTAYVPDGTDGQREVVVERLLTRQQAACARTVLDYVAAHAPHHDPQVHLAVLMLTLRTARTGTGNVTGQDLTGWLADDTERVLNQLVAADWLRLPGTVTEALASRPESPALVTVPSLLPRDPYPFTFGKSTRPKLSGWAQKTVGDRKLRKKKAGAATRLLALYTAAHTRPDGRLGHPEDGGIPLQAAAAFCALPVEESSEHAAQLVAADWLTEADTADGLLRGRLAERVWPLGGLL